MDKEIMIRGTVFTYSEDEGKVQFSAEWRGQIQKIEKQTVVYLIKVTDRDSREDKLIAIHRTNEGDWVPSLFNEERDRDFINAFIEAKEREEAENYSN